MDVNYDGTVVAGMIKNQDAEFNYPVIFKLDNGKWTYSFPSIIVKNNGSLDILESNVGIRIYDLTGKKVFEGNHLSGSIDTGLTKGLYIMTVIDGNSNYTKKIGF